MAATPAIATMTMGVAIPSLRPLSTVRSRRTREGTTVLVTTGTPSAASVGARAAPTKRASQGLNPGKNHAASAQPNTIVRGRAMPSSRAYRPRSRRGSCTGSRAASEKSTQTRVISASGLGVSGADEASTRPNAASAAPMATKKTGAVRSVVRAERRPPPTRRLPR